MTQCSSMAEMQTHCVQRAYQPEFCCLHKEIHLWLLEKYAFFHALGGYKKKGG